MLPPTAQALLRPLVRLPAVLFPNQAISFTKRLKGAAPSTSTTLSFELPEELFDECRRYHDCRLAAFGPGSRIGTELRVIYDDDLDALVPTPSGVTHAVGGLRVRLSCVKSSVERSLPTKQNPISEVIPIADEELSEARQERLEDEAAIARSLVLRGAELGAFALESSVLDEEVGGADVCDPRCHPLFPLQQKAPESAAELSLWLGSRLPLSTSLRANLLANLCPLRRLQDSVDAMRLLCDPHNSARVGHKYKVLTTHAANDAYCGTMGGQPRPPQLVVAESPPAFTPWDHDSSTPHG